jgi:excisionase family DNA binding protein
MSNHNSIKAQSTSPAPILAVPSPYLTISEAAAYLRTTEWFIAEKIRTGDLPKGKMGKKFVVSTKDLDELFEKMKDVA